MFGNLCGPHGEIMWEIAFFYVPNCKIKLDKKSHLC